MEKPITIQGVLDGINLKKLFDERNKESLDSVIVEGEDESPANPGLRIETWGTRFCGATVTWP
jgi:hypothetical protein